MAKQDEIVLTNRQKDLAIRALTAYAQSLAGLAKKAKDEAVPAAETAVQKVIGEIEEIKTALL